MCYIYETPQTWDPRVITIHTGVEWDVASDVLVRCFSNVGQNKAARTYPTKQFECPFKLVPIVPIACPGLHPQVTLTLSRARGLSN